MLETRFFLRNPYNKRR